MEFRPLMWKWSPQGPLDPRVLHSKGLWEPWAGNGRAGSAAFALLILKEVELRFGLYQAPLFV